MEIQSKCAHQKQRRHLHGPICPSASATIEAKRKAPDPPNAPVRRGRRPGRGRGQARGGGGRLEGLVLNNHRSSHSSHQVFHGVESDWFCPVSCTCWSHEPQILFYKNGNSEAAPCRLRQLSVVLSRVLCEECRHGCVAAIRDLRSHWARVSS